MVNIRHRYLTTLLGNRYCFNNPFLVKDYFNLKLYVTTAEHL